MGSDINLVELTDDMLSLASELGISRSNRPNSHGDATEYAIGYALIMLGLIRGKYKLEGANKKQPEDLLNLGRFFIE
jgi:hypothetical protein